MLGENLAGKTIAATTAQTVTWNDSEISNDHIGSWIYNNSGANNALDNALTNVRVRVGGQPLWDVTGPILRVAIEAMGPANTIPATGRLTVSLPMVKNDRWYFEYACHEGNYAIVGILAGARAEEQAAAKKGSR